MPWQLRKRTGGTILMKTYGIICEYNPFHNGHIYQIEETKKQTGATHIVAIMSGNYVQRGEPALMDKFKRAEIAVKNGVDLVIEMPVQYCLANAELFARCGVMLLGSLRCVEGISFGSESGSSRNVQTLLWLSPPPRTSSLCLNRVCLSPTLFISW